MVKFLGGNFPASIINTSNKDLAITLSYFCVVCVPRSRVSRFIVISQASGTLNNTGHSVVFTLDGENHVAVNPPDLASTAAVGKTRGSITRGYSSAPLQKLRRRRRNKQEEIYNNIDQNYEPLRSETQIYLNRNNIQSRQSSEKIQQSFRKQRVSSLRNNNQSYQDEGTSHRTQVADDVQSGSEVRITAAMQFENSYESRRVKRQEQRRGEKYGSDLFAGVAGVRYVADTAQQADDGSVRGNRDRYHQSLPLNQQQKIVDYRDTGSNVSISTFDAALLHRGDERTNRLVTGNHGNTALGGDKMIQDRTTMILDDGRIVMQDDDRMMQDDDRMMQDDGRLYGGLSEEGHGRAPVINITGGPLSYRYQVRQMRQDWSIR